MANIFRRPRAGAARLAIYVAICVGATLGLNGWIFAAGGAEWSAGLANPPWAPAGWVIGTVWVGLFALMGASLWAVDRAEDPPRAGPARAAILLVLGVCLAWPAAYFGLQSVTNGFAVTIAAWGLALLAAAFAFRVSALAGTLLIPLVAWLTFAIALSATVWRLNA